MKRIKKLLGVFGLTPDQFQGMLDYITGVLLITLPWFFVNEGNMTKLLPIMFSGILLTVYSMFTDYRYGLIRWISSRAGIILDLAAGAGLVAVGYPVTGFSYLGILVVIAGILIIASVMVFEIIGKGITFFPERELALPEF